VLYVYDSFLFDYDKNDYAAWAWGLKKAGYATNPIYAQTLIKYIEQYKLNLLNNFEEIPNEADLNNFLTAFRETNNISLEATNTNTLAINKTATNEEVENDPEENKVLTIEKENYPSGIFKVNGLKVIHAKKGTALLALAKKHKLQLSHLLTWNDLPKNTTILDEDQLVFIQKKRKTGSTQYHVIKKNEDLREISQKEGMQLSSLLKLNKLKPGMNPRQGEKLSLKIQRKYMPQVIEKTAVHIVKKGESLYTISKKYNVSIDSIKDANSINNDELQVGQRLKILK
jgi:LysM repeat protein